jgi:hypothetical protein
MQHQAFGYLNPMYARETGLIAQQLGRRVLLYIHPKQSGLADEWQVEIRSILISSGFGQHWAVARPRADTFEVLALATPSGSVCVC